MEYVGVLGATGSIGINTLDVIANFPDRFRVSMLSTNSNIELLLKQVKKFKPYAVCIVDGNSAEKFKKIKSGIVKVYKGEEGLWRMIEDVRIDALLVAIVGSTALKPILTGLKKVKKIALANKEALVMAGSIIMKSAIKNKAKILPVDSEHSAIFQCLSGSSDAEIKKIYLTGSGGPLLNMPESNFKGITIEKAINHPKWRMGRKISIDSATMMNKGLEVIEAHHLFGVTVDKIEVLIHPEAVVHSMVEFIDGSILAQMAICDMRIPIQYALTYPDRFSSGTKEVVFSKIRSLNFYNPDFKKFPCLGLAYEAGRQAGTYPAALNASNEVAVGEFLKGRTGFTDIPWVIEKIMALHNNAHNPDLGHILEIDAWARRKTLELLSDNKEMRKCYR